MEREDCSYFFIGIPLFGFGGSVGSRGPFVEPFFGRAVPNNETFATREVSTRTLVRGEPQLQDGKLSRLLLRFTSSLFSVSPPSSTPRS